MNDRWNRPRAEAQVGTGEEGDDDGFPIRIDKRNRAEVFVNRSLHRIAAHLAFQLGRRQNLSEYRIEGEPDHRRPRRRWIAARPELALTWGKRASGRAFIGHVAAFGAFAPTSAILEIGPGYGRLLAAILELGLPFSRYLGADISPQNIHYLKERFRLSNVEFMCSDAETLELPGPYDLAISSLTFKHLFPSFERCAQSIVRALRPGGLLCFDLIEGTEAYYEADGMTFVRCYSNAEVARILRGAGFAAITYDTVWHTPTRPRLFVAARRTDGAGRQPPAGTVS